MVAVPETVGVHWKTCSGDSPERPQLPASALVPLVVPLKVPPGAGMAVGLLQSPARAAEVGAAWPSPAGALTGRLRPSSAPPHASTRLTAASHAATPAAQRYARSSQAASAPAS